MSQQSYPLPELPGVPPSAVPDTNAAIKVFLVNGESRSMRLDDRADVNVRITL